MEKTRKLMDYMDHTVEFIVGYFSLVESTFLELEVGYPDDEYLEALAFQIAQQYLYHALANRRQEYKDDCKRWLEKTIKLAKGADTFYSHLAVAMV